MLEDRDVSDARTYKTSGNVLLDGLHGAHIVKLDKGVDGKAAMADLAADLTRRGRRPYVVPGGGSSPLGSVACALSARGFCRPDFCHIFASFA